MNLVRIRDFNSLLQHRPGRAIFRASEFDHALDISDLNIMAMKHKSKFIYGLQFHPESILTEEGKQIVKNFVEMEG